MSLAVAERLPGPAVPVGRVAKPGFRELVGQIWPLLLLLTSFFLLSPEVRITVIGINLPAYRLLALALSWHWISALSRHEFRLMSVDWLIILVNIWILISFSYHYGIGTGVVRGMGVVVDTASAYFLARSCIRTPADLRLLFLLLIPPLLLAGLEMLTESVIKDFVVRPAYGKIFGRVSAYAAGNGGAAEGVLDLRKEYRLGGLMRAMGPFSHPILGGLTLTSTLLIFLTSGIRSWPKYVGCFAAFLGFFALSSATILSLVVSLALFFGDKLIAYLRSVSWWMISIFLIIVGLTVEFASKGGLVNILIRQTLDPQTGYYRKMIWDWGLRSVGKHPWFGIGYAEYERPLGLLPSGSVDAHFLASGMVFGVVVPLANLLAVIIAQLKLGAVIGRGRGADRNLLFGLNAAMFGMMFTSMTVTYFGEARLWFMAFIGMVASMSQLKLARLPIENLPSRDRSES